MARTLRRGNFQGRFGIGASPAALFPALLWALHPVQNGSVTYISQRAESLMGLFSLLTLYCFIRGTERGTRATRWQAGAVLACAAGMAVKEVMVTAPLACFLYDAVFISGGREHLERHGGETAREPSRARLAGTLAPRRAGEIPQCDAPLRRGRAAQPVGCGHVAQSRRGSHGPR